jgi:uncharacterized protein YjdB
MVAVLAALIAVGCGDSAGSCSEDVAQPSISLEVTPATAKVGVGETVAFAAHQRTCEGELQAVPEASWSSANETIVTVDAATGVATAKAVGKAVISAAWGPGTASATLEVMPP